MPYLSEASYKSSLLVATPNIMTPEFRFGTIVTQKSFKDLKPAPWVFAEMESPGHIWYWLNENDCGPNGTAGRLFGSLVSSFYCQVMLNSGRNICQGNR